MNIIDCVHFDDGRCTHPNRVRTGQAAALFGPYPGCILLTEGNCSDQIKAESNQNPVPESWRKFVENG